MLINFLGFCPTYTVIWTPRLLSTLAYLARIGLSIFICLLFLCQKVKTLFEKKSFLQYQLTDQWFSNDCISFSIACLIGESWLGSFLSLDLSSSLMKFKIMETGNRWSVYTSLYRLFCKSPIWGRLRKGFSHAQKYFWPVFSPTLTSVLESKVKIICQTDWREILSA